jgi:hypothetical protein
VVQTPLAFNRALRRLLPMTVSVVLMAAFIAR